MATFAYSFTFANAATTDGGNIQTDMNDLRTFIINSVAHGDAANYPTGLGTFAARARRVAVQSINSATRTDISWDTIDSDPNTMVSGANVTIKSAGWYVFCATQNTALSTTASVYLNWTFSVGPTLMPLSANNESVSARDLRVVATCMHKCALNEVLKVQFLHNIGSAQNITASMWVRKISAL